MEFMRLSVKVNKVDDKYAVANVNLMRPKYSKGVVDRAEAVASVCPTDSFDEYLGAELATGRALEKLGKKMQKKAWTRIKNRDEEKRKLIERKQVAKVKAQKTYKEKIKRQEK